MNFNIELQHLETFLVVSEEMNFRRAAERLNITQPPLSRQINRLETALDAKLFDRDRTSVQLTDAGRALITEARQILDRVERGVQTVQQASRGEVGQLIVGFEGSSAYEIVPRLLQIHQKRFPNVDITVRQMATGMQLQALRKREIAVGFIVPFVQDALLTMETILREPMILALPENHLLAQQAEISLLDLVNEDFIVGPREKGCGLSERAIAACHNAGFRPKIIQETEEMQITLGFIAVGLGIALLPTSSQKLQQSGVVYRPISSPKPEIELAISWLSNNRSNLLQNFITTVRETIASD
ncbi:LysR family transcriptional regulator [Oscillatoriales cyanobacterium LEGE 11467]|uniref:LysR family transcriptional regulator n=1 Tax=Zarconia navalis LEGE 11467 TaxID=1828826 RepID=A0A928W0H5_9CYAN|nr:LysR family transcriptional regulator [Zarconia navalis]MBE9041623.1 LysR family transcriptional regulator [Zarconia navalis LEGE 11467]